RELGSSALSRFALLTLALQTRALGASSCALFSGDPPFVGGARFGDPPAFRAASDHALAGRIVFEMASVLPIARALTRREACASAA
ncbi:MAG TPA: hypothetical protein VN804_06270, partial [Solirubrobacteraceae bacterium]|nr:hypothetical protein [Solirubrobacteraceae bacterium]